MLPLLPDWKVTAAFKLDEARLVFFASHDDRGFWLVGDDGGCVANQIDGLPPSTARLLMTAIVADLRERAMPTRNPTNDAVLPELIDNALRVMFGGDKFQMARFLVRSGGELTLLGNVSLASKPIAELTSVQSFGPGATRQYSMIVHSDDFRVAYVTSSATTIQCEIFGSYDVRASASITIRGEQRISIALYDDWNPASLEVTVWALFISLARADHSTEMPSADASRTAIIVNPGHIGHHVWSELPFIAHALRASDQSCKVVCLSPLEAVGPIEAIFPELTSHVLRPGRDYESYDELAIEMQSQGYRLVRAAGRYVPKMLRDRVHVALRNVESRVVELNTNPGARRKVVFNIRVGDRCWEEQARGIAHVISGLAHPERFTYLLTGSNDQGFSLLGGTSGHADNLAAEQVVASQVKALLDDRYDVRDLVGTTVFYDLAACLHAELLVAPWGAGLAKYRWLLNIPAILFSNTVVLENYGDKEIYSSAEFMEDPTPVAFLPAHAISPGRLDFAGMPNARATFNVDADALLAAVQDALLLGA